MRRLAHYFHSLFSSSAAAQDDPLTGAIDLSDSAYCFELLSRHGGR